MRSVTLYVFIIPCKSEDCKKYSALASVIYFLYSKPWWYHYGYWFCGYSTNSRHLTFIAHRNSYFLR